MFVKCYLVAGIQKHLDSHSIITFLWRQLHYLFAFRFLFNLKTVTPGKNLVRFRFFRVRTGSGYILESQRV